MAGLPSGTVTLVFSDIEGSTRLLRRLGPDYEALLMEHRRLVRGAFAGAGGVEVETRGDSFLVAFASARAAVEGAVAAQRALVSHPWHEGVEPRVRMGVHTGEPLVTAEGYVGIDVHRAARIGDAANGGQVLVSESTRALLGDEAVLKDLGEYRLAGLEQPEHLYQVTAPGLASEFGSLRAQRHEQRRRERRRKPTDITEIGWRVHALRTVGPPALSHPLESLSGSVLSGARLIAAADATVAAADRNELDSRLADLQMRASAAPHVAEAAAGLERQLAALDQLPERRRAVEDLIARIDDELESLALRLRSAPKAGAAPALAEELDDLRSRLVAAERLLEETNAAAPSAPAIPDGRWRRTHRRGIFRVGSAYVVVAADEHGVKRPRVAASLSEAIGLRESLRAARHRGADPRNRPGPYYLDTDRVSWNSRRKP